MSTSTIQSISLCSLCNKSCWLWVKKCWCQWNSKGVFIWYVCFFDLLWVYNCAKFHNCRICVTDFSEGAFLDHPSMSSPENAHPEKLKNNYGLPYLSSKTQRCASSTTNHFNVETFFDKFEQQIFLALAVNCKGQQNCSHTMECK